MKSRITTLLLGYLSASSRGLRSSESRPHLWTSTILQRWRRCPRTRCRVRSGRAGAPPCEGDRMPGHGCRPERGLLRGRQRADWACGSAFSSSQETQRSSIASPFPFDAAWSIHVSMNVADKGLLYASVAHVPKPGAPFVLFDILSAGAEQPQYPAPWAATPEQSFLATARRTAMNGSGQSGRVRRGGL